MRYDRDFRARGPRSRGGSAGRGEYGDSFKGPSVRGGFREGFDARGGFREGFDGGALRSRGSWNAGARGYEPGEEFEWGDGYVGGRGYGGTNYDLEHGYATGGRGFGSRPRGAPLREGDTEFSSPASRGGYAWGEAEASEEYGPARYGYGPYYHRLRTRRRPDEELKEEIEETLFYDTWVDAEAISVTVQDGVVTLRGTLPNYEELRYAVDDAWDVDGVRGVRSELEVREERGGGWDRTWQRQDRYVAGASHMHGHPEAAAEARRSDRSEEVRGQERGSADERGSTQNAAGRSGSSTQAPAGRSGRGRGSSGAATGSAASTSAKSGARGRGSRAGGTGPGGGARKRTDQQQAAGKGDEGGTPEAPDTQARTGDGSPGLTQG